MRGRCDQAVKNKAETCSVLDAIGCRLCGHSGDWVKDTRLGKSRGVRFYSRLVWSVGYNVLWVWKCCSVFLLALRVSPRTPLFLFCMQRRGCCEFYSDARGKFCLTSLAFTPERTYSTERNVSLFSGPPMGTFFAKEKQNPRSYSLVWWLGWAGTSSLQTHHPNIPKQKQPQRRQLRVNGSLQLARSLRQWSALRACTTLGDRFLITRLLQPATFTETSQCTSQLFTPEGLDRRDLRSERTVPCWGSLEVCNCQWPGELEMQRRKQQTLLFWRFVRILPDDFSLRRFLANFSVCQELFDLVFVIS